MDDVVVKILGYDFVSGNWVPVIVNSLGILQVSDPPAEEPSEVFYYGWC